MKKFKFLFLLISLLVCSGQLAKEIGRAHV